ncbi:hypothetical protein Z043_106900 [Scleropages formosus]|uniref:Uncharacterized protein n=1 Tax=Scleropages formosus TaxID=113540 RepID=A0A0P7Z0W9_SCLFO|nr:hypothetical protein Z043_106900 [Scleropages formosus]
MQQDCSLTGWTHVSRAPLTSSSSWLPRTRAVLLRMEDAR